VLNFAVVYLGKNIPSYVYRNLARMKKDFPHHPTYFVSDNEVALSKARAVGSKVFKVNLKNGSVEKLENNLKHPKDFRKGFWLHTTSRFFALEELSKFLKEPIIQIEADVMLFSTFPVTKFNAIKMISYPLESSDTGAASVFFAPDHSSLQEFNEFILNTTEKNGFETDMTLLGKYYAEYPNKVTVLPSIPPGTSEGGANNDLLNASKNYHTFLGLFDPLTYGLHILGEDPKNNCGKIIFGSKPKLHLISNLDLDFKIKDNSLYLNYQSQEFLIHCLHIHSKNNRVFDPRRSTSELQKSIIFAKEHKIKFSYVTFLGLMVRALLRRAWRQKSER
jgi:hypothetical protein